jgi:hypothetical protein
MPFPELRCAAAPECLDKGDAYTAAEVDGCRQAHLVVHSAVQERQLRALVQASQHTEAHRQRVDERAQDKGEMRLLFGWQDGVRQRNH